MKKHWLKALICGLAIVGLSMSTFAAPKTTLRWYLRWDKARLDKVATPVKEEYEKLHPDVEIIIENISNGSEYFDKLQTMLAANSAPDVIYPATHQAYQLAAKKQIIDLMPFVKKDKLDLKAYIPSVLNMYQYKSGKTTVLQGLPIDTATFVIFYNKDMFDAAKVPYPTDNMTWDQFFEMSKKLVKDTNGDGKIDQYAIHWDTNNYWSLFVYQMTGKYMFDNLYEPKQFLLKNANQVQALQRYADVIAKYHLAPTPSQRGQITDLFLAGNAAMNMIGHWRVPTYNASVKFRWDVAALPHGKFPANRGDGSCFSISKDCKNPAQAWEFVKYLAGPDAPGVMKLLSLGQMVPSQTKLTQSELFLNTPGQVKINKKAFLAGRQTMIPMYQPFTTWYNEWENGFLGAFNDMWEGKTTAAQAVKNITPKVEALMSGI